jgi:hypothetical protein
MGLTSPRKGAEQTTFLRSRPVQTNDVEDPLDRRIASLRSSLERESRNGRAHEYGEARSPKRPRHPALVLRSVLRQRRRLTGADGFGIKVYGFAVAIAIVLGWLISHLH